MINKKSKNLYLYLALACFAGIIAIFIVDGYLGIYDTVYITSLERDQKVEPSYWEESWVGERGYSIGVGWGEPVNFRYEIENSRFSAYAANLEVSVWKSGEEIIELLDKDISVAAFDTVTVDWVLPAKELEDAGFGISEYTVKIKHGEMERKIILGYHYSSGPVPPKVVPSRR